MLNELRKRGIEPKSEWSQNDFEAFQEIRKDSELKKIDFEQSCYVSSGSAYAGQFFPNQRQFEGVKLTLESILKTERHFYFVLTNCEGFEVVTDLEEIKALLKVDSILRNKIKLKSEFFQIGARKYIFEAVSDGAFVVRSCAVGSCRLNRTQEYYLEFVGTLSDGVIVDFESLEIERKKAINDRAYEVFEMLTREQQAELYSNYDYIPNRSDKSLNDWAFDYARKSIEKEINTKPAEKEINADIEECFKFAQNKAEYIENRFDFSPCYGKSKSNIIHLKPRDILAFYKKDFLNAINAKFTEEAEQEAGKIFELFQEEEQQHIAEAKKIAEALKTIKAENAKTFKIEFLTGKVLTVDYASIVTENEGEKIKIVLFYRDANHWGNSRKPIEEIKSISYKRKKYYSFD